MESHDLRGAGLTQETGEHIQVLQYHTLNFSPSFVLLKVELEQPQQKNPSCFIVCFLFHKTLFHRLTSCSHVHTSLRSNKDKL